MDVTAEKAREHFKYLPETGELINRVAKGKIGHVAGWVDSCGYRRVYLCGKRRLAHRVIWLMMTGDWPKGDIDHINRVRSDNRWGNLRDVDRSTNLQNRKHSNKNSKSGFLGVTNHYGKWAAVITANGRYIRLGSFDTPEKAHAAYIKAKRKVHDGCAI